MVTQLSPKLQEVRAFVATLNSWFSTQEEENGSKYLLIDTRDNGDVGDESPGQKDIAEGRRIAKALREKYPELNVSLDVVDEWVQVAVDDGPKRYSSQQLAAALAKVLNVPENAIGRIGGTNEVAYLGHVVLVWGFDYQTQTVGTRLFPQSQSMWTHTGPSFPVPDLSKLNDVYRRATGTQAGNEIQQGKDSTRQQDAAQDR